MRKAIARLYFSWLSCWGRSRGIRGHVYTLAAAFTAANGDMYIFIWHGGLCIYFADGCLPFSCEVNIISDPRVNKPNNRQVAENTT